ncbi:hypothetical protein V9T40_006157 [Parthenolecanium corni]|uniref:Vesicle transport protein USE1 n=1 Tax=Parthenolecanium corni TaxID=536013 RepID=A0AAN9YA84_9HEMI
MVKSKTSRLEVDVKRLLSKCEEMANTNDDEESWRLSKFVEAVDEMIVNLQNSPIKPEKDNLQKYQSRVEFLKGLLETRKMENLMQKSIAVQMLAPPSSLNATAAQEIYQKSLASCETDLRKELFGDSSELRQRSSTFEPSGSQEFDSILKHHNRKHEQTASDMLIMARNLKEQNELAGRIIREDTKTLEKSSKGMDDNFYNLQKQSNRLQIFISKSGWNCWIWILLAVMIIIFINMVFFMKVARKSY